MKCYSFLLVLFSIPMFSSQSFAQARKDALVSDEYAVYSAVIAKNYIKEKEDVRLVVITSPTCCEVTGKLEDSVVPHFKFTPPGIIPSQETLDSYAERNKTSATLRTSFTLNVKYRIVPYERIEKLFDMIELDEDWKTFYRWYPRSNGYVRLSRVGFNRAGDEALVSTGWMCGSRCGEGSYILLRKKKDGQWNIEASATTWVS